jgi:tetratricopeptide (TPR) repeat protein
MMTDRKFNLALKIDENLREVPEDADDMKLGILSLLKKAAALEDLGKKGLILAKAGILYRVLGNLDLSEKYLTESFTLLKENDKKAEAYDVRLRLSMTHIYQNKFEEAEKVFLDIIEKANAKQPPEESLRKLKELALIGLGKSKFEQNMIPAGIRNFTEAGESKLERGDSAGFSKCKEMIELAKKKKAEVTGAVSAESVPDNYIDPLLAGSSEEDL